MYDKKAMAKIYWDLVQADRRKEESVPEVLREEYDKLKADSNA